MNMTIEQRLDRIESILKIEGKILPEIVLFHESVVNPTSEKSYTFFAPKNHHGSIGSGKEVGGNPYFTSIGDGYCYFSNSEYKNVKYISVRLTDGIHINVYECDISKDFFQAYNYQDHKTMYDLIKQYITLYKVKL